MDTIVEYNENYGSKMKGRIERIIIISEIEVYGGIRPNVGPASEGRSKPLTSLTYILILGTEYPG